MKKRILAMLLLVALCMSLTLFTGCNQASNATPNFDVPEVGYDGSEVTVTFYHTMSAEKLQPALEAAIEEFNKLYPNIHIVHSQVGGYDEVRDQIATEIPVGNQPDIAYCYPDHVALYNKAKAAVTLDNLIASTISVTRADGTTEVLGLTAEQKADFIETYYNEGKVFGSELMYTLPLSKSTEVLYYNKDFFTANKLKVPTTWEEMEQVCAQIKALDPNCIPLGYDSEANWFITMCEQYGSPYTSATGDHYLFDNETNRNFVKKFREWFQKGYVTTQTLYGKYTSGMFTEQNPGPEAPNSYMSIGSTGGATHQLPKRQDGSYAFEVGIAPIPQVNADNPKAISQGPSLCLFQNDNPQVTVAAWLFAKYLCTDVTFQAEFSMASGYMPVIKSVKENPIYKEWLESANGSQYIAAMCVKVGLENEASYYTSPAFVGSSTARDQVGSLLNACISATNVTDVDTMIKKAFEDAIDECEYQGG